MDLVMSLVSVVFINIILSGDNAIVIALASRELPPAQMKKAIFWGSALAVILRVLLVIAATLLMKIPYLQFAGGVALVYIGYQLLAGQGGEHELEASDSLGKAIKTILVADVIMSLDNVLAIAGVAEGNWLVLGIGLAVSVPLVVFGAQFLSALMNKWPILVYIGAGLIAYTAAEMMVSDTKTGQYLEPYATVIKIAVTLGVLGFGYWAHKKAGPEPQKSLKSDT
ncbi:MAG TPA: TerC family protein [Syntrophomonadaceae bacterium]|nr:TerC family protein [Syntrophomonadaceae bacterium]